MLSGLGAGYFFFASLKRVTLVGGVKKKTPPPTIRKTAMPSRVFYMGLCPKPYKPQRLDRQPAVQGTSARSVPVT